MARPNNGSWYESQNRNRRARPLQSSCVTGSNLRLIARTRERPADSVSPVSPSLFLSALIVPAESAAVREAQETKGGSGSGQAREHLVEERLSVGKRKLLGLAQELFPRGGVE